MATQVQIRETRTVIFVNGVQTFRIVVQCTDRGTLPDKHLFLKKIIDVDDPQQDTFERIVELADLDELNDDSEEPGYKPNRESAISAGQQYWRSDTFTKDYTDIEIADSARTAISDRLNTLVSDFETYDDAFKTNPTQILYYPSADQTTIDSLKAAYNTAYTAYQSAQSDVTSKQSALTEAENELSAAETSLNEWSDFKDDMQALTDSASAISFQTCKGAFSAFASTYAKNVIACIDKFTEDYTYYFPRYQEQLLEIKLNASPWPRDITDDDVGKAVTDSPSGGSNTGTLVGYDNDDRTILVTPDDPKDSNQFDTVNNIDINGVSYWTMSEPATVVVDAGEGPNLQELIACRDRFAQYRLTAETDVSNANAGVSKASSVKSNVDSQVVSKTADVTAARTTVTNAQKDFNEAQANLQTAYDDLEAAYNAVKTVCPNWSPDNTFPPLPSTA